MPARVLQAMAAPASSKLTAEAPRTQRWSFFHLPVRGRQMKNPYPLSGMACASRPSGELTF